MRAVRWFPFSLKEASSWSGSASATPTKTGPDIVPDIVVSSGNAAELDNMLSGEIGNKVDNKVNKKLKAVNMASSGSTKGSMASTRSLPGPEQMLALKVSAVTNATVHLLLSIMLLIYFIGIYTHNDIQSHFCGRWVVWVLPSVCCSSFAFLSLFAVLSVTTLLLEVGLATNRPLLIIPWKFTANYGIVFFWIQQVLGCAMIVLWNGGRVEMVLTTLAVTALVTLCWFESYSNICQVYQVMVDQFTKKAEVKIVSTKVDDKTGRKKDICQRKSTHKETTEIQFETEKDTDQKDGDDQPVADNTGDPSHV